MNEKPTAAPCGIDKISNAFKRRQEAGGKVLIPYIMAGDPDMAATGNVVRTLSEIGADIIEVGMPFSDPLADGPVIQRAGERALRKGVTLRNLLETIAEWRRTIDTPIIIMTYYNLFLKYGLEQFAADAAKSGVNGLIVPDLPYEEAKPLHTALQDRGIALIYLLAPTSTDDRVSAIAGVAKGFLYYVSRTGVTGARQDISADLEENLKRIRTMTDLPIAVGFGVSKPEQAVTVTQHADGAVIGSAIVRIIEECPESPEREAARFLKSFIKALHG